MAWKLFGWTFNGDDEDEDREELEDLDSNKEKDDDYWAALQADAEADAEYEEERLRDEEEEILREEEEADRIYYSDEHQEALRRFERNPSRYGRREWGAPAFCNCTNGSLLIWEGSEYVCEKCKRTYNRPEYLDLIHADPPSHKCYICENNYPDCKSKCRFAR